MEVLREFIQKIIIPKTTKRQRRINYLRRGRSWWNFFYKQHVRQSFMLINVTFSISGRRNLFVQDPMDIWFSFMYFTRLAYILVF